jgi:D-methionine transport system substrate-binding protein
MTKKTVFEAHSIGFSARSGLAALFASVVALIGLTVAAPTFAADKTIKVGIISGDDEDVWRVVKTEAAKKGLTIETVVFNDYTQPNDRSSMVKWMPTPSSTSPISTIR